MKNLFVILIALVLFAGCKKDEPAAKADLYPDQPVSTPSSSAIATFHQNVTFYQPFVYRFDPVANRWTARIGSHFSSVPASDPTALGFTNSQVANSGVALFDMVRLYSSQIGSTNINTAKINAEKVLQFFPDFDGAKTGIVKVVDQDITITRTNSTTFKIGISGGGTYNEVTRIMDLEVRFNETAIGGTSQTIKYKISPVALTLN